MLIFKKQLQMHQSVGKKKKAMFKENYEWLWVN